MFDLKLHVIIKMQISYNMLYLLLHKHVCTNTYISKVLRMEINIREILYIIYTQIYIFTELMF